MSFKDLELDEEMLSRRSRGDMLSLVYFMDSGSELSLMYDFYVEAPSGEIKARKKIQFVSGEPETKLIRAEIKNALGRTEIDKFEFIGMSSDVCVASRETNLDIQIYAIKIDFPSRK